MTYAIHMMRHVNCMLYDLMGFWQQTKFTNCSMLKITKKSNTETSRHHQLWSYNGITYWCIQLTILCILNLCTCTIFMFRFRFGIQTQEKYQVAVEPSTSRHATPSTSWHHIATMCALILRILLLERWYWYTHANNQIE